MKKRTDVHRPSVVIPDDYDFVSFHSHHEEDFYLNEMNREMFRQHMAAHPGAKFSTHSHGGSCHVCGANAATVARFYHIPTNTYVEVGETCMEKMGSGDPKAFKYFLKAGRDARQNAAGKAKAEMFLKDAGLDRAWELFLEWTTEDVDYHFRVEGHMITLSDIVHKLIKYGSISEKQQAYLAKLIEMIDNHAKVQAERDAERAAAADVPEGRIEIEGEVVSVKINEGFYGYQIKMTVKHESGWVVWGTMPNALVEEVEGRQEELKGQKVRFTATVKAAEDDPKFGYFKRPTKAEITTSR